MKRISLLLAGALALSLVAVAQTAQPQKKDDAAKPADAVPTKPADAAPAKPAGGTKTAPEPKTKEEQEAMQAVVAKQDDPAAMETAADEFATKYPDSNVRGMLYRALMFSYQAKGDQDKSYEAGRKALKFDADDPLTLALCSMYLSSHTHDSDLDKDERLADARKMANDAIANLDNLRLNNKAQENERAGIQSFVKGTAYGSLGVAAQATKDWKTAEINYQKSADANADAATLVRLGFAQKMQGKLDLALTNFNKAIEVGNQQQATAVVQFATDQKTKTEAEMKSKKAAPAPAPAPAAAPSTTPAPSPTPKQ